MKYLLSIILLSVSTLMHAQILMQPDMAKLSDYARMAPELLVSKNLNFTEEVVDTLGPGKGMYLVKRTVYYDCHRIMCSMEFFRNKVTDTITMPNPENTDYDTVIISEYDHYTPQGEYLEYHDDADNKIKTRGRYYMGKKIGLWETNLNTSKEGLIQANYNDDGFLEGKYIEYHPINKKTDKSTVRCEGNFAVIEINGPNLQKLSGKPYKMSRPSGEWVFYNKYGDLLETVKFER